MKISDINNLKSKCTGCLACIDSCAINCISSEIDEEGFIFPKINLNRCVNCGKCFFVCPIIKKQENKFEQKLYAAYANDLDIQNGGSSGGIFEILAKFCLKKNYYICGAMFENTKLIHKIINEENDLKPLLKSKYLQSDTEGIYIKILNLLKLGEKVFFCGTPCQVSALQNVIPDKYKPQLLTADIICHGVPSQQIFDLYIDFLKKKYKGDISDFLFRVKNNKYKHAHGFSFKVKRKNKSFVVNSVYTKSSFYNAFKNYQIFRESCYECKYATLKRVSDITLADFWGIEKYNFDANVDKGVSMILINSQKGENIFSDVLSEVKYKEFPIEYGVESNYCLTHSTKRPAIRDRIFKEIKSYGYEFVAKKYFKEGLKFKIYWLIPSKIRYYLRKKRG